MGKKRGRLDRHTVERLLAERKQRVAAVCSAEPVAGELLDIWTAAATSPCEESAESLLALRSLQAERRHRANALRAAARQRQNQVNERAVQCDVATSPSAPSHVEEIQEHLSNGLSIGEIAAIRQSSIAEVRELLIEAAVAELDETPRRISIRRPSQTEGLIQRWIDLYETPEPIIILTGRMTVTPPVEPIDLSGLRPLPGSGRRYRARKRDPRPRIVPQDDLRL